MTEIWKDVKEYEGLYQVSNEGNLRSLDRITKDSIGRERFYKGQHIKPAVNGSGYLQANLYKNGNKYQAFLHKLVAKAFIENPLSLKEVNHIDHNKLNCKADNLEWCTRSDNMIKMAEFYGIRKDVSLCENESCSNPTYTSGILCDSCYRTSTRKTERPSKDELLYLIKNNSFLEVGRMFNVSDNAIRKWCKSYSLPYRKKDLLQQ